MKSSNRLKVNSLCELLDNLKIERKDLNRVRHEHAPPLPFFFTNARGQRTRIPAHSGLNSAILALVDRVYEESISEVLERLVELGVTVDDEGDAQ